MKKKIKLHIWFDDDNFCQTSGVVFIFYSTVCLFHSLTMRSIWRRNRITVPIHFYFRLCFVRSLFWAGMRVHNCDGDCVIACNVIWFHMRAVVTLIFQLQQWMWHLVLRFWEGWICFMAIFFFDCCCCCCHSSNALRLTNFLLLLMLWNCILGWIEITLVIFFIDLIKLIKPIKSRRATPSKNKIGWKNMHSSDLEICKSQHVVNIGLVGTGISVEFSIYLGWWLPLLPLATAVIR